jgi:hypothetical protein
MVCAFFSEYIVMGLYRRGLIFGWVSIQNAVSASNMVGVSIWGEGVIFGWAYIRNAVSACNMVGLSMGGEGLYSESLYGT